MKLIWICQEKGVWNFRVPFRGRETDLGQAKHDEIMTSKALKQWEANNEGTPAVEATEISLINHSIAKLDSKALGTLKKCEKLSLR